jgi:hypothetical protein
MIESASVLWSVFQSMAAVFAMCISTGGCLRGRYAPGQFSSPPEIRARRRENCINSLNISSILRFPKSNDNSKGSAFHNCMKESLVLQTIAEGWQSGSLINKVPFPDVKECFDRRARITSRASGHSFLKQGELTRNPFVSYSRNAESTFSPDDSLLSRRHELASLYPISLTAINPPYR